MTVEELARRDGWHCWVCGGEVDRSVPPTAPGAPTVDHVLPRARGGRSDAANLRLAHRRCNGRRGSALPELSWPADVAVSAPAPLWPVVQRRLRRPGEWEVVGLLGTERDAERAAAWLRRAVPLVMGGRWEAAADRDGAGPWRLRLRSASAKR